jgi:hypothetical protein
MNLSSGFEASIFGVARETRARADGVNPNSVISDRIVIMFFAATLIHGETTG